MDEISLIPAKATGNLFLKVISKRELTYADAMEFTEAIPSVKSLVDIKKGAATLYSRFKEGDKEACYRQASWVTNIKTMSFLGGGGADGECPKDVANYPTVKYLGLICLKDCQYWDKREDRTIPLVPCSLFCATEEYCAKLQANALADVLTFATTVGQIMVQSGAIDPM